MDNEPNAKTTRPWVWIVAAGGGLLILICVCIVALVIVTGVFGFRTFVSGPPQSVQVTTVMVQPTATPPGASPPTSTEEPATTDAPPATGEPAGTEEATDPAGFSAELPPRDRYDLAQRFLGVREAALPEPVTYEVGDVTTFWVGNDDTETTVEVSAELAYMNEHVYMWVEQGVRYELSAIQRSADRFAEETYPTTRAFFGSEASPGIDGDPRLHILHSIELGSSVAGYFYSPSEYPASVVPYSNEKEIFFINIGNTPPGNDYYDGVLAHEFQHMIHWAVDANEESWMNEGLSEVAAFLNGFGPSGFAPFFLMNPDLQLTHWPEGGGAGANYGAGFLFNTYYLDRFGQDALRELVANPLNGLAGVDDTLDQVGADVTADAFFVDWTLANLLNDPDAAGGLYSYASLPDLMPAFVETTIAEYPAEGDQTVHQYGADYIELLEPGEVTLTFDGEDQVRIIPANTADTDDDPATNDRYVWWSNRGDDSNMTLTREIDLSGVEDAALAYDVWFQIETLWDFAYLSISADGGETWVIVETPHTTTEDPHGNSYGPGYTGSSADMAGASPDGWLEEEIDLSEYAGQEILIRFEMLTDDAVNQPGLAVDNICVEAIGWCDDVESGDEGWEAAGFLRHNNVLEQHFSVTVVVPGARGAIEVLEVPLDDENRGELTFEVDAEPAYLVVSGLTRYTTEAAPYELSIAPVGN